MKTRPLKIVCYVPTFNAGDTTRGIEVTRALVRKADSVGRATDVTFVCPPIAGTNFEDVIRRAGFAIDHTAVPLSDAEIQAFMTADRTGTEFIPDYERAHLYIAKYIEDLRDRKPDLLVNGCIPPAGIAARIVGVPTVTYLPFPAHRPWVTKHLLKDIPDPLENAVTIRMPNWLRRLFTKLVSRLVTGQRFFRQPTTARAGQALGWNEQQPNLLSMLKADVELVNDLPDYYRGQDVGPRTRVTGPLFSRPPDAPVDPLILKMFRPENANKVLVTMGSSGEKKFLLEAVRAVSNGEFHAVVVVQPTICSLAEARAAVRIPDRVYLTDAFIPAHQVNALADAVVIHGGQGTVQTAISSGTPFVGVGMQAEQQTNLDNAVARGAGLRIARKFWTAPAVERSLREVLGMGRFKAAATALARSFASIDGSVEAGEAIWRLVEAQDL